MLIEKDWKHTWMDPFLHECCTSAAEAMRPHQGGILLPSKLHGVNVTSSMIGRNSVFWHGCIIRACLTFSSQSLCRFFA